MTVTKSTSIHFMLEACDLDLRCPVLQARFRVPDPRTLQAVLGDQANDDPELQRLYLLDGALLARVVAEFGAQFDPTMLKCDESDVCLYRIDPRWAATPYLVHTGYELFLMLEGRKKLARMKEPYPPMTFDGEDRFDYWVKRGLLHREELVEPFDAPRRGYGGLRTVYYTSKGDEWRIPAMKLVWRAAGKAGGWNEYFERLEGMLFGYEDWQNDWWIETGRRQGGFGGASLCCAVSAAGLTWLEAAGFRALPPCDKETLAIINYDDHRPADMHAFLSRDADNVALACFVVPLWRARDLLPLSPDFEGQWLLPRHRVPELNRHLRNPVVVIARGS